MVSLDDLFQACRQDNAKLLQHWKETDQLPEIHQMSNFWYPYEVALMHGSATVLDWITTHDPSCVDSILNNSLAITTLLEVGALDALKWLNTQRHSTGRSAFKDGFEAVVTASLKDQLEVVDWFVHDSGYVIDLAQQSNFLLREVVHLGLDRLASWIVNDSGQYANICRVGCSGQLIQRYENCEKLQLRQFLDRQLAQLAKRLSANPVCVQAFASGLAITLPELQVLDQQTTAISRAAAMKKL